MGAVLKTVHGVKVMWEFESPSLRHFIHGELAEFGLMQHFAKVPNVEKCSKGSNPLLSEFLGDIAQMDRAVPF